MGLFGNSEQIQEPQQKVVEYGAQQAQQTYQTSTETTRESVLGGTTGRLFELYDSNKFLFIFLLCLIISIGNILETGTLVGFTIPLDGVLFATTLFLVSAKERGLLVMVYILAILTTCIGDWIGYWTGSKLGSKLYERPDTWFFKKKYLVEAQHYFKEYGNSVMFAGRFTSIGNFLPHMSGAFQVPLGPFVVYSFLSAVVWTSSIVIPTTILGLIFPSFTSNWKLIGLFMIIIYTMPEIVAWCYFLRKPAGVYIDRIKSSQEHLQAIAQDFKGFGSHAKNLITHITHGDTVGILDVTSQPTTSQPQIVAQSQTTSRQGAQSDQNSSDQKI